MKAILLSIKPKWVAKILNGEKTLEIRKKFPANYRGWVYIYCTKEDNLCCIKKIAKDKYICGKDFDIKDFNYLASGYEGKGKVVARFWCDKVERIWKTTTSVWLCENEISDKLYKGSCLSDIELDRYFKPEKLGVNYTYGRAIHISDLEIFDRPKELSEFKVKGYERVKVIGNPYNVSFFGSVNYHYEKKPILKPLTKAPQNYCYVESEE